MDDWVQVPYTPLKNQCAIRKSIGNSDWLDVYKAGNSWNAESHVFGKTCYAAYRYQLSTIEDAKAAAEREYLKLKSLLERS